MFTDLTFTARRLRFRLEVIMTVLICTIGSIVRIEETILVLELECLVEEE